MFTTFVHLTHSNTSPRSTSSTLPENVHDEKQQTTFWQIRRSTWTIRRMLQVLGEYRRDVRPGIKRF